MKIDCINANYYQTKIPFKNEQKELVQTSFNDSDYVIIPREKYEKNRKWSIILTSIIGLDLAFSLYRYFKK